jgi:DnaJ-class molecular chaperone
MDDPKLIPCPECGGTGKVPLRLDSLPGPAPPLEIDCPTCGGTGLVRDPFPVRQVERLGNRVSPHDCEGNDGAPRSRTWRA